MISTPNRAMGAACQRCIPSLPFCSSRSVQNRRRTTAAVCRATNLSKRETIAAAALWPAAQLLLNASAAHAEDAQRYVDSADGFSLTLPAGWVQQETTLEGNSSFTGASGARRTLVWYSPDIPADQVNVTLTITNTSVEFTKLGSFGNVYTFGQNLVNSMDERFLLRVRGAPESQPVQVAMLEDAAEQRGMYFVEYTIEKRPTGPKRHLYSLVALSNNGRYNRLYTLNAQCREEQLGEAEQVLKSVLSSFSPPPARVA